MRGDTGGWGSMPGGALAVLANAVGYQAVWFCAVIGAGRGLAWPALAAATVFIAAGFRRPGRRGRDLRLLVAAVGCGLVIDGSLAQSGLATYAVPSSAIGGAPTWILAIWAAFAMTLARSMRWMLPRPGLAMALGALGGPLAYLAAERGWQAISFGATPWPALVLLSIGWAAAMPLLCLLARGRAGRRRTGAAGADGRAVPGRG